MSKTVFIGEARAVLAPVGPHIDLAREESEGRLPCVLPAVEFLRRGAGKLPAR